MDVWIIEVDDYETGVDGVALSVEAASRFVRAPYGPPYIVRWDEPQWEDDEHASLTGHFTAVKDKCGDGLQTWNFTRFQVEE